MLVSRTDASSDACADNGQEYIDDDDGSSDDDEVQVIEEDDEGDDDDNDDNIAENSDINASTEDDIDVLGDDIASDNDSDMDDGNNYDSEEEGISLVMEGDHSATSGEDFDLIQHILSKKKEVKKRPHVITIKNSVEDLKFHVSLDLLAVATIKGDILLIKYDCQVPKKVKLLENHLKACRAIDFSKDGQCVLSVSADKCLVVCDMETFNLLRVIEEAHENPLTVVHSITDKTFATGDSNGVIKFWDVRDKKPTASFTLVNEYVSALISAEEYMAVLGADGTISALNVRHSKKIDQGYSFDGCINSGSLFRDDTRLIASSSEGEMVFFKWGEFNNPLELYTPCKNIGINNVVSLRSLVSAISCEDGHIRAINVYPHRPLGIIGSHGDSVESLSVSPDGNYLASACFDNDIKIWDLSYLDTVVQYKNFKRHTQDEYHLPSSEGTNKSDFFNDLK